jgi:hypothetical protein
MAHRAYWSRRLPNTDFYSTGFRLHSQLRPRTSVSASFQVFLSPSRNILGLYQPSIQDHSHKRHFQLIIHSHPISLRRVSLSSFKQRGRRHSHLSSEKRQKRERLTNILYCPVTITNLYLHSFRNFPRNYKTTA